MKSPLVVVFFGYDGAQDSDNPALTSLLMHSITILPAVEPGANVTSALPPSLRHVNALTFDGADGAFARLVSLTLENLRRNERRTGGSLLVIVERSPSLSRFNFMNVSMLVVSMCFSTHAVFRTALIS